MDKYYKTEFPFYFKEKYLKGLDETDRYKLYIEDDDWAYAITVFDKKLNEYIERYHMITDVQEFVSDFKHNND